MATFTIEYQTVASIMVEKRKFRLINSKFLGCKELDSSISDVELGGLLHSIGNKKWTLKKSKHVALCFAHKFFLIAVKHQSREKTQVCDLRDVSKISVHPTRDRVVGFVLNDRSSQKRQFLCFKLCKKSKIKGHEFKRLHQKRLRLYHPQPKIRVTRPQLLQRCTIPMGQARQVQAGNTLKVARPRLRREKLPQILCVAGHPMPLAPAEENKSNPHRYGYYINGKVVKVAYRSEEIHVPQIIPPPPPPLPPVQVPSNEPITGTIHESPTYENLSQLQDIMC